MIRRQRGLKLHALAPDFAAGLLAALGQAPFGLWPLAFLAWGFGLRRVARAGSAKTAFLRSLLFGAGHFGLALSWIVQPFFVDPWRHGWMAPFALVLMGFGLALFYALPAFGLWRGGMMGARKGGAVLLALAWSLSEILRGHVFTGFPWALPGHIWLDSWLAQTGALWGGYGLTLLTLLAAALVVDFGRKGAALAGLTGVALGGWSLMQLAAIDPPANPAIGNATLRLVQPDIAQSLKWDADQAIENFDILLGLTRNSGADLVLWPETAVPWLISPGEGASRAIAQAGGDALVLAGYQRREGDQAWNSLGLFTEGGWINPTFDKKHLVPFGEYMPMGDLLYDLFGIRAFAAQAGAGYSAGLTRDPMDLGPNLGRMLPLICYEAIFPAELRHTGPRPDWIFQATNDAWFGTLTGPYQHFAQVRLRAIEQGLPLVRVSNTGISAVIDARGRIAPDVNGAPAYMGLSQRGVIEARIPPALSAPLYARMGDWPLIVLIFMAFLLLGARALCKKP